MIVETVNVVATAVLDRPVHPEELVESFPEDVLYDPAIYACAYFKSREMKGKVSIFFSGKMISIGTKSEEDAKRDLIFVASALERRGIAKLKEPPRIQNVVVTADLGGELDLGKVLGVLPHSIFEPEQFPGLIHNMGFPSSSITALIFSSGKIVCVGAKSERQARGAVERLLSKIARCCEA